MPPWCESILGLKVETVQGIQVPWNGLRYMGDSGNGGTTLEFLSTFKTRIDSHHSCTWGSPVGKPRGKASRETTDPLIHAKGRVTLLLQLGRKAHVHAPTRVED